MSMARSAAASSHSAPWYWPAEQCRDRRGKPFGMRTLFEDQFAERRRRRSDQARDQRGCARSSSRHIADGWDGMCSATVVCLLIAAHAHMRSDPLALEEDFELPTVSRASTSARAKRWGNAVIMGDDLNVIVDANAACLPFGELELFGRKRLQRRAIDLFAAIAGASRRAAGSGALRSDASSARRSPHSPPPGRKRFGGEAAE